MQQFSAVGILKCTQQPEAKGKLVYENRLRHWFAPDGPGKAASNV
jgi:hypothetical protein